jgi:hydrogenase maturation protease
MEIYREAGIRRKEVAPPGHHGKSDPGHTGSLFFRHFRHRSSCLQVGTSGAILNSILESEITGRMINTARTPLILGVGNLLMGDEGVGIHAVRLLENEPIPKTIRLLDGGTGGFHLLSLFQEHDPIIMIDATMDGGIPGKVTMLQPRFASDFPRTLSAHDIGLRDLLESATLIGPLPTLHLITICIGEIVPMTTELSSPVAAALPQVVSAVWTILRSLSLVA